MSHNIAIHIVLTLPDEVPPESAIKAIICAADNAMREVTGGKHVESFGYAEPMNDDEVAELRADLRAEVAENHGEDTTVAIDAITGAEVPAPKSALFASPDDPVHEEVNAKVKAAAGRKLN